MEPVVNIIAVVLALGGVLVSLAHVGYLALLGGAARERAGGAPVTRYVRERRGIAAGTTAAALAAWLMTSADSIPVDVVAALLAVGSAAVATKALGTTRERFRSGG